MSNVTPFRLFSIFALFQYCQLQTRSTNSCTTVRYSHQFLDLEKFAGTWYEFGSYYSIFKKDLICSSLHVMATSDKFVFLHVALHSQHGNALVLATAVGHLVNYQQDHPPVLETTYPMANATVHYEVLDTDYNTYAILWTCENSHDGTGSTVFAWVLLRHNYIPPHRTQWFLQKLSSFGIKPSALNINKCHDNVALSNMHALCDTLPPRNSKTCPGENTVPLVPGTTEDIPAPRKDPPNHDDVQPKEPILPKPSMPKSVISLPISLMARFLASMMNMWHSTSPSEPGPPKATVPTTKRSIPPSPPATQSHPGPSPPSSEPLTSTPISIETPSTTEFVCPGHFICERRHTTTAPSTTSVPSTTPSTTPFNCPPGYKCETIPTTTTETPKTTIICPPGYKCEPIPTTTTETPKTTIICPAGFTCEPVPTTTVSNPKCLADPCSPPEPQNTCSESYCVPVTSCPSQAFSCPASNCPTCPIFTTDGYRWGSCDEATPQTIPPTTETPCENGTTTEGQQPQNPDHSTPASGSPAKDPSDNPTVITTTTPNGSKSTRGK